MASIKIKLFANLREHTGKSEVMLDGDTILDILNSLTKQYTSLKEIIFEDNTEEPQLRGYINVFINGNSIHHLDGFSTVLEQGDEVAIFPPVSGG